MYRAPLVLSIAVFVAALGTGAALGQTNAAAGTASSGFATNSAAFNGGFGLGSGGENRATTGQVRDANGNLTIVNGVMTGTSVSRQDGVNQSGAGYGASAVAIGNSLNVNVIGNWNTVIVDSTQTNNGDQSASAALNGELEF